LVWLSKSKLLLLAAPFAQPGLEAGLGTVLIEVAVQLLPRLLVPWS